MILLLLFLVPSFALLENFKDLTPSQQASAILDIRKFLVQQEQKQIHFHNQFAFLNEAFAAESRLIIPNASNICTSDEQAANLSKGLQRLVTERRDRCVIAGNTVCMAITSQKRMSCRLNEMPGTSDVLRGSCQPGEIECAYPIFMSKKTGGKICHKEQVGLTQICDDEAQTATELSEALSSDPSLVRAFKKMIENVENYCGTTAGSKPINSFDHSDCNSLYKRLALKKSDEHITNCKVNGNEFVSSFNFKELSDGSSVYREVIVPPRPNGLWMVGQAGKSVAEIKPLTTTKISDVKTRLVMTNSNHEDNGEIIFDQNEHCAFSVLNSLAGTYDSTKKTCTIGGNTVSVASPSAELLFPKLGNAHPTIEIKTGEKACLAIAKVVYRGEVVSSQGSDKIPQSTK